MNDCIKHEAWAEAVTAVKQRDGESGAKLAGAMCRVMDAVRPQFEALYTEG